LHLGINLKKGPENIRNLSQNQKKETIAIKNIRAKGVDNYIIIS